MRRVVRGTVAAAVCGLTLLAGASATAATQALSLGPDGETAPVYSYTNAIRERVWVPVAGVDQDADGVTDRVALDIARPAETATGLKVPAIVYTSPYLTSLGEEGQFLHTTGSAPDRFPMFYDNFFVPRGYAVILAEAIGTGFSTGCPLQGGPGDIAGMKAVIDWLQGRVQGFDAVDGGNPVVAGWDNGKAAMIGTSYSGTLANGVAATGVDGLTTIVPISAISDWYRYSRSNGVRFNLEHYPASLSGAIVQNAIAANLGVVPPDRTTLCWATRTQMSADDGDATGDVNAFWQARNYDTNVGNVQASVFASAGLNDDNVKFDHLTTWWAGLAGHNVPRKLWLSQEGHIDPFDYRRDVWVDTLHRWFDYWLYGVQNGIMNEPRVTIERSTDVWENDLDWPLPGTSGANVFLNGSAPGSAGTFGALANANTSMLSFADLPGQTENASINTPDGSQANRLVFLSPVLRKDVHVSGVPTIDLHGSFSTASGNLGVVLMDYSATPFTRPTRNGGGVAISPGNFSCVGLEDLTAWPLDGCSFPVKTKPTVSVTQWLVSNGVLDATNRDSLTLPAPLIPAMSYAFDFPLIGNDYVFPAGHRIGLVVVSSYQDYGAFGTVTIGMPTVTIDTHLSKVVLPVVGGSTAARSAGVYLDTTAPTLDLPSPLTVEATGPTTPVSFAAHASDDLDDAPGVSCSPESGATFALGTTTVTCTGRDAAGNTASNAFAVTVVDTTAPTPTVPRSLTVNATSAKGAKVTFNTTATDVVDAGQNVSCRPASGSTFKTGRTIVQCTATDASANTRTASFPVVVNAAAPQLKTLRAKLAKRLRKRVDGVLAVLGNHRKACAALATLKRSVPAARKADVTRIARVVGC